MPLLSSRLVVLDTETTGLPRDRSSRVWELAAVLLDEDGVEVASFESVMLPDPFPDDREVREALKIGGVDRAMIESAPPAVKEIARFVDWLPVDVPVTAFNIGFDRELLSRSGMPRLRWTTCIMMAAHRDMSLDPECPLHQWDSGEYKWPRLDEAAAYYGVAQQEPAHRAMADVRTSVGVLLELQRRALARRNG